MDKCSHCKWKGLLKNFRYDGPVDFFYVQSGYKSLDIGLRMLNTDDESRGMIACCNSEIHVSIIYGDDEPQVLPDALLCQMMSIKVRDKCVLVPKK